MMLAAGTGTAMAATPDSTPTGHSTTHHQGNESDYVIYDGQRFDTSTEAVGGGVPTIPESVTCLAPGKVGKLALGKFFTVFNDLALAFNDDENFWQILGANTIGAMPGDQGADCVDAATSLLHHNKPSSTASDRDE
jgi:hypothetical protein